jgi:hypothetical protein
MSDVIGLFFDRISFAIVPHNRRGYRAKLTAKSGALCKALYLVGIAPLTKDQNQFFDFQMQTDTCNIGITFFQSPKRMYNSLVDSLLSSSIADEYDP